ncbi:DUF2505 domain-containing protein [Nocardioides sp. JQ2195]|uniref:DUF2505 domain-containing protein n=1 Tax=Nocardioides sp. JQ2195 TaxID=2592334 RepID=UPI00143E5372|nr:DUF2505 domain-containing protein [Nocardioides sp. JQ2195]QIX25955.1 DUF2505 domain-containing protein [Nocardioides sp. JQ2195]
MKITHSVRYDAPVAEVYAMLTDPAFRERASKAQDTTEVNVSVDGGTVNIDMVQPNKDIPSFAKAIAGETSRALQEETWSGGRSAAFSVTLPGKPGSITGVRTLVADGDGTLDTFEGEAKVKVPLVGGKIEKLIAEKLKDGWDIEQSVGAAWLGGDR